MTILKKSNCNGVEIVTEKVVDKYGEYHTVTLCDRYDEFAEPEIFDDLTEEEALKLHDEFVEEYRGKPNWNAQAAYDQAHGTINGQDPMIAMWENEY